MIIRSTNNEEEGRNKSGGETTDREVAWEERREKIRRTRRETKREGHTHRKAAG